MKCVCSQQKEIKMKRKIIIFLIFVFVSNVSFAHDVQQIKLILITLILSLWITQIWLMDT